MKVVYSFFAIVILITGSLESKKLTLQAAQNVCSSITDKAAHDRCIESAIR